MSHLSFDAIVVGGGSGGLACAKRAASLGAKVALIERRDLGGTCVNRGCVPKKLLWDAGWHRVKQTRNDIQSDPNSDDFASLQNRIEAKIKNLRETFDEALSDHGIELFRGEARLSKGSVEVDAQHLQAPNIIIATGARPIDLKGMQGAEHAENSDSVLNWKTLPESAVFLGGGYIGCELASIFSALGVACTVIDTGPRLLSQFSEDLADQAETVMRERGIDIVLDVQPARLSAGKADVTVHFDDAESVTANKVIAAIGRTPNVDNLGPLTSDLVCAESGALAVDERFQTSVEGVFAIGDAADRLPLTPVATRDGETLAEMLFGQHDIKPIDLNYVASAAFVMPPVAEVGSPGSGQNASGNDLAAEVLAPKDHWSTRTFHQISKDENGSVTSVALMAEAAADMIAPFGALIAARDHEDAENAATGVHPTFGEETVGR